MAKIIITGASSGLGEGTARHLAARGHKLALLARRRDRLDQLATELATSPGGKPLVDELDVTEFPRVRETILRVAESLGGLDIVIANAGVAATTPAGKGHFDEIRRTIDTNLLGAIATIEAAVEIFRKQQGGHVVGITSIAAVRGLRNFGAYSASKAGLGRYLEALRLEVGREGIQVTDLSPGYIDTDLNRNVKNRPFVVSAERGTAEIADLVEKKVAFRYVPVWPWTIIAQVLKVLPRSVVGRM
jgi:short-subunit dehydrogenase